MSAHVPSSLFSLRRTLTGIGVSAILVAGLGLMGCGEDDEPDAVARATMEPRSGSSATGTATFTEKDGRVEVVVEVSNATPGNHGLHVHDTGDCSSADALTAGSHFNPDNQPHDGLGPGPHHAGDLTNITVGSDGRGRLEKTVETQNLSVQSGSQSVVGRAIILHAAEDDLTSQPTGNSGARIACGVIR